MSKSNSRFKYTQLWSCGHLAITNTPIIRTAAKSSAKINYRRLTEINSRYYGLSLLRTLTRGPEGVRTEKGELTVALHKIIHAFFYCSLCHSYDSLHFYIF